MPMKLQRMIRDPQREVGDPDSLAERTDLTDQEKLQVLEAWRVDLTEMQKAVEENMTRVGGTQGDVAARLARVMVAIARIDGRATH